MIEKEIFNPTSSFTYEFWIFSTYKYIYKIIINNNNCIKFKKMRPSEESFFLRDWKEIFNPTSFFIYKFYIILII